MRRKNISFGNISSGTNDLDRKQAFAEALMSRGSTPLDPNRMAGGLVVPISPWEGLSQVGQTLLGAYMQKGVSDKRQQLAEQQRQGLAEALKGSDKSAVRDYLLQSDNPLYQEAGTKMLAESLKAKDPIKMGDRYLLDPETMQPIFEAPQELTPFQRESLDLRRQQMQDSTDLRRQMLDLQKMNIGAMNRPPAGYRFTPDGSLEPIPGGPADTKVNASQNKIDVPGFELASGATPTPDDAKKLKDANSAFLGVSGRVDKLRSLVKDYGTEVLPFAKQAEMKQTIKQVQLELKELANLGVLNGPDLMVLQQMLPDPTAPASLRFTQKDYNTLFDNFNGYLDNKLSAQAQARGYQRKVPQQSASTGAGLPASASPGFTPDQVQAELRRRGLVK